MRVILIIPPSPWLISDTDVLPLGILYIARSIEEYGETCIICDLAGLTEDQWKIPIGDIYGITGTSPHFNSMKKITEILKNRESKKWVIWGGPHTTIMPEHVLSTTGADACILGEGEKNFPLMCISHKEGKKIFAHIDGVAYRNRNHIKINYPKRIKNLSELKWPARNEVDFYKYSKTKTSKYIIGDCRETTIFTSRGCPYNCSFCAQYSIWGGKVYYRDKDDIRKELTFLKQKYGINLIWIMDDTFLLNKELTKDICKIMGKLGLYWHCLSRVDKIDSDTVSMMYDHGCKQIMFGFESGSDKMLNYMNKRFTVEQSRKAIEIVKKFNIKIRGQMIVGFPFENDITVQETARFIMESDIDAWGLHVFQPFPGCDVWNSPEKYNYKIDKEKLINNGFQSMHTIGKPDQIPSSNRDIRDWITYLQSIADKRNVHNLGAQDE